MAFGIKDLVGLSQPLTKLLEVCAAGIGKAYEPIGIRLMALAKRSEIGLIADKIKDIGTLSLEGVEYRNGEVHIISRSAPSLSALPLQELNSAKLELGTLQDRAAARLQFQSQRQQGNVEKIIFHASADLSEESSVPEEKPDEDWVSRFFACAQDISSDQAQQLWGRILAGEIKRPGTFSLRSLDLVRNLSKAEARIFEKIAAWALSYGELVFVPLFDETWFQTERQTHFIQFATLADIGLIFPPQVNVTLFPDQGTDALLGYAQGETVLVIQETHISPLVFNAWKFSKIGAELIALTLRQTDEEYLDMLGCYFQQNGKQSAVGVAKKQSSGQSIFTPRRVLGNAIK
ncbi:MAG TPA: DUF2806 domain-containing protein [Chthoniobacterales bacterium]|nr:DUF2806 domain-containing protein [Chthoniobacterales bacterium]